MTFSIYVRDLIAKSERMNECASHFVYLTVDPETNEKRIYISSFVIAIHSIPRFCRGGKDIIVMAASSSNYGDITKTRLTRAPMEVIIKAELDCNPWTF